VTALGVYRVIVASMSPSGVSSVDPIAFAAAPVSLLLVSVIAALVPALRAARTNPVTALRAGVVSL
jgi:ABC-type lipoprotein release transport system permease subunit